MEITVKDLGKQFKEEWIFRNLDYRFLSENIYAIIGPNGSGKSTLIQVLSGYLPQSNGTVNYRSGEGTISPEDFYLHISVATPYIELIEEFTTRELLEFHFKFKALSPSIHLDEFLEVIELAGTDDKMIKNFSSGMKQRLKLGLAFYAQAPIILLDEPTTNLDAKGVDWYQALLDTNKHQKLIVIASNQPYEYSQCNQQVNIQDYKLKTARGIL